MATPSLHWLSASGEEQTYPITAAEPLIGSKCDSDFVLGDLHMSHHPSIVCVSSDGVFVQDLGSTHGTFVNGQRVGERQRMADGDRLELGKDHVELHFFTGDGTIQKKSSKFDTTEVFQKSLTDL